MKIYRNDHTYINIDISTEELCELLGAAEEKKQNIKPGEDGEFYHIDDMVNKVSITLSIPGELNPCNQ